MKVLFTQNYGEENFNKIIRLGYDVIYIDERKLCYTDEIKDIEILQCFNPFKKIDISKLEKLKYIQLSSTGFDQLPFDKIDKNNIVVCNNYGGYSIPIGEWVVSKILEVYKCSRDIYDKQKEKKWKINLEVDEIYNKNILFLGTGTLAFESAKRLQGFGVKISGFNSDGRSVEYFDKIITEPKLKEELRIADIVVCTLPLTKHTKNYVDENLFSYMKDGSLFMNISRGNTVDEKALVKYSSKFKAIVLDVFNNEPLDKESELWELDNVYISSHNSWISSMRNKRKFDMIYNNLVAYKNREPLENIVDIKKGY